MRRLIVCLLVLGSAPSLAQASARSYSLPTEGGKAISACLADGQSCGKPAADHFCQLAGYSEAILFARERVTSAVALDSDRRCDGEACEAFTRIKCYTPGEGEQASAG